MDLQPIDDDRLSGPHSDDEAVSGGIPPKTWQLLSEAGHSAAQRLADLLASPGFTRLKPADQARLIELGLNRAYGPPVKRAATLELRGTVSDAVADSLARLSAVDLPETARSAPERPAQSVEDVAPSADPPERRTAFQRRAQRRNVKQAI